MQNIYTHKLTMFKKKLKQLVSKITIKSLFYLAEIYVGFPILFIIFLAL